MSEQNEVWLRVLRTYGWRTGASWDICWLDCPEAGYVLVDDDRAICLCPEHAIVLQEGCWNGDYSGAPLPPDSKATAWPWQWLRDWARASA